MLIKMNKRKERELCCEYCERVIIREVDPADYIETCFYCFDTDALLICRDCKIEIKGK